MKRCAVLLAWILVAGMTLPAMADPVTPTYSVTFSDAVTGDAPNPVNSTFWVIDAGADSYQNEVYERPTTQTYTNQGGGTVGAAEYFGNLDIVEGKAGFDSRYLYFSINMFSTQHIDGSGNSQTEGLIYRYDIRLSDSATDGANGFLFTSTQPGLLGTAYQLQKNEGFKDTNGDVGGAGGLNVTKDDGDVAGNGFDLKIIGDGKILDGANKDAAVFFSRINPGDNTIVEFAIDYVLLGINPASLLYLDFEAIKGDPEDPQNYLWNDKYTFDEAGTPYTTEGLGNIYELDTLRGGPLSVPEPSSLLLLGIGLAAGFGRKWLARNV